jgi:hypothetical protein
MTSGMGFGADRARRTSSSSTRDAQSPSPLASAAHSAPFPESVRSATVMPCASSTAPRATIPVPTLSKRALTVQLELGATGALSDASS